MYSIILHFNQCVCVCVCVCLFSFNIATLQINKVIEILLKIEFETMIKMSSSPCI